MKPPQTTHVEQSKIARSDFLVRKRPAGRADSAVSEATLKNEDDVVEIARDIPVPIGRPRLDLAQYPRENLRIPDEVGSEYSEGDEEEEEPNGAIQTKHMVPEWFPKRIKEVFLLDRHGGQLTFKELDRITKYRNAMERVKRIKWKTYLKEGRTRWQLQRYIRRMRPVAKEIPRLIEYRKAQLQRSDEMALKKWKRLEKLHLGLRVLDEAIDLNFRQERMIYEKKLGGRLRN